VHREEPGYKAPGSFYALYSPSVVEVVFSEVLPHNPCGMPTVIVDAPR
jgi:hypothetical protein